VIEYSLSTGYYENRVDAEAYFNLKNYMIQSVVGALIMGVVTTAVVAFFLRAKASS
jgi:hypothetical protein